MMRYHYSGCSWVWVRGPTARRGDACGGIPERNVRVLAGGAPSASALLCGGGRDRGDEARDEGVCARHGAMDDSRR